MGIKKARRSIKLESLLLNIMFIFILSLGLSAIGMLMPEYFDIPTVIRHLSNPLLIIFNALPLTFIMLLLYFITSRVWISFSISGLLFLAIETANRFKIILREEPVTPADFFLGAEAARVLKLSELPINLFLVTVFLFFIMASIFLFRFVKSRKLRWPLRAVGAAVSIILLLASYGTVYKNGALYNSFKINGSIYSIVNQYRSRGFVYSFLVKANTFKFGKPEGYTREEAEKLLVRSENAKGADEPSQMPNIIAVMGEAFYDIDRIKGVEFNNGYEPLKNFNRIKEQAYSGRIVTSVFGGGTANTEFAFLTGHSLSLLNDMSSPYILYLRKDTFSLARVLEKKGYDTMAFHPGDPWFYNRTNVYEYFGFDNKYFKDDMDRTKVKVNYGYISDMDAADFALGKLKDHISRKPDTPFFDFVVNIENHGPYASKDLGLPKMLKRSAGMDDETYNNLNNYVNGVSRCDAAMGHLTDTLENMDEPVVLLFFADHLPYLGQGGNSGYKALNFNVGQNAGPQAYLNQYETPYFIWSNKAARELLAKDGKAVPTGEAPIVSANYLATELLDYIGMDGGGYFGYLKGLRNKLPVITQRFFEENGKYTENLTDESRNLVEQYRRLQYYMMTDKASINP